MNPLRAYLPFFLCDYLQVALAKTQIDAKQECFETQGTKSTMLLFNLNFPICSMLLM